MDQAGIVIRFAIGSVGAVATHAQKCRAWIASTHAIDLRKKVK